MWIESENSEEQSHFDQKTDQNQSCLQNTFPTPWIQPENSEENQKLQSFNEKTNQVSLENIPTVWIQPENSENQQLYFDEKTDFLKYAPTCVSDFNLAWVQFVMQQYYEANFSDKKNVKPPTVRRFTVGIAGGNPDENEKASKGYVHFVIKRFFLSNWLGYEYM